MAQLTITYDGAATLKFEVAAEILASAKGRRYLTEAVTGAGMKARTQVRRALKQQMGTKRARPINANTRSYVTDGGFAFVIEGSGKGLPIEEFPVRVVKAGVWASPWAKGGCSTLLRQRPRLCARLGKSRFPIRKLFGPALPKELAGPVAGGVPRPVRASARILPQKLARLMPERAAHHHHRQPHPR
jgi:hypothetical protein